ncbi:MULTISPECIES: hypothetical protein [Rahnella]|uniref:Lytic transglycosylase n=1 Tax=Rahnella laticis TaxID=2787622 RepID=A0ABS0E0R4_9GAMM|nr:MULTISPECIES: hypothetical protein [Rahnella]MBF7978646.1 hypothetical protein [Rahnella laticis]MBF7998736.1 hypothetical protein [Rahnella sp. LAC-M12]
MKKLTPQLNDAQKVVQLGGRRSAEGLDEVSSRLNKLAKNARDGVQFVGDLVPPLKMVGGLTLGLGGLATVINGVKTGIKEYADSGYKIDTTAKNISATTRAYQELTGAMIENGATRDSAESSVTGLYQRANDALNGRDDPFNALLAQMGVKISKTKEGMADVVKLMDDLNKAMLQQSPARQSVIAQVGQFSPELLNYLRQSTEQVQRLKDQAQRDGLIFSDKDVQNALAFRNQVNQISASWDGMLMKGQAWLGQAPIVQKSFDDASQIMQHGFDAATVGSLMTWNSGGKQADRLRDAQKNDAFKKTLSWDEKLDLRLGYASGDLVKKLNSFYGPTDKARQLQKDVQGLYVQGPSSVEPPLSFNQPGNGNARGIRNNNPGNLRAAPNAVGNDGSFPIFSSANDGLAAMSRQLQLYGGRGNNTPYGIIHTYAPSSENNTQAYINAVTKDTGFGTHDKLNMSDPAVLKRLMTAMIRHENGSQPYSEADIDSGINTSMTDPRWMVPQSVLQSAGINQSGKGAEPNINAPSSASAGASGGGIDVKQVADVLSKVLKDNKNEIELTLINGRTGERKKISGAGGKVTTAMPMP